MNTKPIIDKYNEDLLVISQVNNEFCELYNDLNIEKKYKEIFTTLHALYNSHFRTMNENLPTDKNGALLDKDSSLNLLQTIEFTIKLNTELKDTEYNFEMMDYYSTLINQCRDFLSWSGGSKIPPNMATIKLCYDEPMFTLPLSIKIPNHQTNTTVAMNLIGSGSYANVYKYKDDFYNRSFAVKRAKKNLNTKEIERFKREFEVMNQLTSPYIVEVYRYDENENEFIMEYMDETLQNYINRKNSELNSDSRKQIVLQILNAFDYLHTNDTFHRDISPNNVLIKGIGKTIIVKISDFGLAKILDSTLTSPNTELKGCFNDPALRTEGFNAYNIQHEIYAITLLIFFVMTGKTNTEKIKDAKMKSFVEKGLNPDKSKRYQSVFELREAFCEL